MTSLQVVLLFITGSSGCVSDTMIEVRLLSISPPAFFENWLSRST